MLKKIVIAGVAAGAAMLGAAGLAYAEPSDSEYVNENESEHVVGSDNDDMLGTSLQNDNDSDSFLSNLSDALEF